MSDMTALEGIAQRHSGVRELLAMGAIRDRATRAAPPPSFPRAKLQDLVFQCDLGGCFPGTRTRTESAFLNLSLAAYKHLP